MNDSRSNYGRPPDAIDPLPPANSGGNGGVWLAVVAALVFLVVVLGSMTNSASNSGTPAKAAATSSQFDAEAFAEALNESRPKANAPTATSAAPSLAPTQTMGSSEVSAEVLSRKYATMRYQANGLEAPSESDFKSIAVVICEDLRNGDDGRRYYLANDIPGPDSKAAAVAEALNYAYATTNACHLTSAFDLGNTVRSRLLNYIDENSSAAVPARSFTLPPSEPRPYIPSNGGSVRCNDGSYSSAGGKQGACSWHGGVDN
jgi:hypothetical protein